MRATRVLRCTRCTGSSSGRRSAWTLGHFWDERAYLASPNAKKLLMTVAVMSALGYTSSGGTNGTIIGSDGTLQAASAPRITYDRGASSQLLTYPEDFSQAAWAVTQNGTGTCAKTPNYATAPDGTLTACRVVATKGNSSGYLIQTVTGLPNPHTYAVGVWVKSNTGANQTFALCDPNASATYALATPDWRFVQNAGASAAAAGGILIGAFGGGSDASVDISIWHPQQNTSPVATPYLKTTTTAPLYTAGTPKSQNLASGSATQSVTVFPGCVYSILHQAGGTYTLSGAASGTTTAGTTTTFVAATATLTLTASSTPTLLQVWEGTGTMAYVAGPYSLYYQQGLITEAARTRETLHPFDLTQAAWSCTNITPAKTAIGLPGTANSATTLTATATNGTCLQALTSASANRLLPVWIRSRSASSLTIDLTCDGGTTWVAKTVNAAYMPYMVNQASVTNPSYGIRLRASGDSIDVGYIGGEQYTTLPAVPPMPIWGTESAAQTKSADLILEPASAISDAGPQTTVVRCTPRAATTGAAQILLGRGGGGFVAYLHSAAGAPAIYDGTNLALSGTAVVGGVPATVATRYSTAGGLGVCLNGGSIVTSSFDGSMGTAGTQGGIGHDGSGNAPFAGLIGSIEIASTAMNDATFQRAALGLVA